VLKQVIMDLFIASTDRPMEVFASGSGECEPAIWFVLLATENSAWYPPSRLDPAKDGVFLSHCCDHACSARGHPLGTIPIMAPTPEGLRLLQTPSNGSRLAE